MRLFNKVANVFFGLIAAVGLFVPLVGYSAAVVSGNYSFFDLVKNAFTSKSDTGFFEILNGLGEYGYKIKAIIMCIALLAGVVLLFALIIVSFTNAGFLTQSILSGLSFAGFVAAMALFNNFAAAIESGAVPISAISGLFSSDSLGGDLSSIVAGFLAGLGAGTDKQVFSLFLGWGAYILSVMTGIMLVINVLYTVFKKKVYELDGVSEKALAEQKKRKKSKKSAEPVLEQEAAEPAGVQAEKPAEPSGASKKGQGVNPNTSKKKLKKRSKK